MSRMQMVRSDQGDGGWSLHPADATDEEIAEGIAPILGSGTATWDSVRGAWNRPGVEDRVAAQAELRRLIDAGAWR